VRGCEESTRGLAGEIDEEYGAHTTVSRQRSQNSGGACVIDDATWRDLNCAIRERTLMDYNEEVKRIISKPLRSRGQIL
jgi:hypothetical protein